MRSRPGFTLIEVVISLSLLLIVSGSLLQGQRNLLRRAEVLPPSVDWYLMLHELENPAHQFYIGDFGPNNVFLNVGNRKDNANSRYRLTVRDKRLILKKGGRGQITMMTGVQRMSYSPDTGLTVVTTRHQRFSAHLLLPTMERNVKSK